MTSPLRQPPPPAPHPAIRGSARRDQLFATVLGIILLVAAMLTKNVLTTQRTSLVQESETSLRSLAIAFPRLTLGGFRGLLATVLWMQAEEDKTDRKWLDLETKYDIIGSLQPYFVSVYVFHSWNQAYNLSAQWHDNDAKYKWVLDGLAYLYKGEEYNPEHPDILLEEGDMYFLKLGNSFERLFYRAHWRSDISRFFELNSNASSLQNDKTEALKLVREIVLRIPAEQRPAPDELQKMSEEDFQKIRQFHTAELTDPSAATTRKGYGISILDPFLFEHRLDGKNPADPFPFRYGLSPYYFAYVEFKRTLAAGVPSTTGMRVVDAKPAMSLRLWCRDDLYYTQKISAALFGPNAALEQVKPDDLVARQRLSDLAAEILDCYRNVDLIAPKAIAEFNEHLVRYPMNEFTHRKHINETLSYHAMGKAEHQLFTALLLWQNNQRKLTPEVRQAFVAALPLYDTSIEAAYHWVDGMFPVKEGQAYDPNRVDFECYARALEARKRGIENLLKTPPTEKPDMSFLLEDTVER